MQISVRMAARRPDEPHRASTPLELFFDLVFVIAVGRAAAGLHEGLAEGHLSVIATFLLVFFAIWWAWMNFTWFASAYDTDDVVYRLTVFVIMAGALIMAAGTERVLAGTSYGVLTLGYVVMRVPMVALWLRVARSYPPGRATALRYAVGIGVLQLLWIGRLLLPTGLALPSFLVLAAAELAVPIWAERAGPTSWHPHHIAERYGLFTIIVLGESLLAATLGVQTAWNADATVANLAPTVVGGLLIVFAMWWTYFDVPTRELTTEAREHYLERGRGIFAWGYGHYVVFASAAAVGAGLDLTIGHVGSGSGHEGAEAGLSSVGIGLAVTIPVALYVLSVWLLQARRSPGDVGPWVVLVAVVSILGASFTPQPVLITGLLLVALVAWGVVDQARRRPQDHPDPAPA